jgi:hypothetical protein
MANLRLVVVQSFRFNAYRHIALEDIDAVIHLGDYAIPLIRTSRYAYHTRTPGPYHLAACSPSVFLLDPTYVWCVSVIRS